MHHTTSLRLVAFASLLALLVAGKTPAQAPVPPPPQPGQPGPAQGGRPLVLPIGGSTPVRMGTGRNILTVNNVKPTVARVQAVPNDPASVLITGLEAGVTDVVLVDVNNARETIVVTVQFDVEYLRHLLVQVVPTATVDVVPGTNSTIILRGNVAHAEDVNTIIRAAQSVVGAPERVINALTVGGVQQVQLDVCVAQVNRSAARSFGFNLLASGPSAIFGSTVGGLASLPTAGTVAPSSFNNSGNGGSSQQTTGIVSGGSISANPSASQFFLGFNAGGTSYLGFLQALRTEGVLKLLAKPTLVALSGQQARFLSGGEQAVPQAAGLGSVAVQFQPFGTGLSFVPVVLGNGKIHLDIHEEVSNLDQALGTTLQGTTVAGRDVQRVDTSVDLEDGQTFVIGGLIQRQINGQTNKVPVLGDLPYVGAAFSTKSFTETENELIVLVTPHLVDGMSCDQLPKIVPGQETRSPDDFELFLEGILEAPRGSREVWPNHRYVPAFKNGLTASQFPCGDEGRCGNDGRCGRNGCAAPPAGAAVVNTPALPPAGMDNRPAEAEGIKPVSALPDAATPSPATDPAAGNPAGTEPAPMQDAAPPPVSPEQPPMQDAAGAPPSGDQPPATLPPPSAPAPDGGRG